MSATAPKMTKARMRQIARRARQYGYLNRGVSEGCTLVEVTCPECRQAVRGYLSQYDQKRNTAAKALDLAMVEHLEHDCGAHIPA